MTAAGATIVEFPISVHRIFGLSIPVAGGGYFRLLPYAISRWALNGINEQSDVFVFYLHPWEVDPEHPRIDGVSFTSRIRHYLNLDRCEGRLRRLLGDFEFVPMRQVLADQALL